MSVARFAAFYDAATQIIKVSHEFDGQFAFFNTKFSDRGKEIGAKLPPRCSPMHHLVIIKYMDEIQG
jgi:hypothetical protein